MTQNGGLHVQVMADSSFKFSLFSLNHGSGSKRESYIAYDILKWIDDEDINDLNKYKLPYEDITIKFEYTSDQIRTRNDIFKRYGKDINALSKIVTRISNLESQFRKVRYIEENFLRDIYKKTGDNFVKYALSN